MFNPFLDILKADVLSPDQATSLFVPEASPIWDEVQRPINQMVVGPRGAGKTMALKQLDHKSTKCHTTQKFVGIYLQISRICTIFGSLFDHARAAGDNELTKMFVRVFSDYVWLEIVRELIDFLKSIEESTKRSIDVTVLRTTLGIQADSTTDAEQQRAELVESIEEAIQRWSASPEAMSWTPTFDLSRSLDRCPDGLRSVVAALNKERPCVYILFDESSPIPVECQTVLNGLLHRGRSYCVKLAIRPFEWNTLNTITGRVIELDTDIWPLQIRYPLDEAYVTQMASVLSRVLRTATTTDVESDFSINIEEIFPADRKYEYSGFSSIARASSGNPQNMLQICSYMYGSQRYGNGSRFTPELQDRVIRAWSKDYEDRNPYAESRTFCRSLLRRIRRESLKSIGFSIVDDQEDLFTSEYLRPTIGNLIMSGFSGGFLRALEPDSARSLFDVPARFSVSRGLLPSAGLPLGLPLEPVKEIDIEFVRRAVRNGPRPGALVGEKKSPIKAFLSTSFSDAIRQQRSDIKNHLLRVGVLCDDLDDDLDAQFLFSGIVKKIRESDFVVLDATVLRPYTMLEIGICAGAPGRPKDVVCVINEDRPGVILNLPEFMQSLPILTFSFDSGHLEELAGKIVSRAEGLLGQKSEFSRVAITRASLRPSRRQHSVYVSLPPSSIRSRAITAVRTDLEPAGWNVVAEEDGESYCANEFQVSTYCAHLTRIGVIDTTGLDGLDLLQCYRLGIVCG